MSGVDFGFGVAMILFYLKCCFLDFTPWIDFFQNSAPFIPHDLILLTMNFSVITGGIHGITNTNIFALHANHVHHKIEWNSWYCNTNIVESYSEKFEDIHIFPTYDIIDGPLEVIDLDLGKYDVKDYENIKKLFDSIKNMDRKGLF